MYTYMHVHIYIYIYIYTHNRNKTTYIHILHYIILCYITLYMILHYTEALLRCRERPRGAWPDGRSDSKYVIMIIIQITYLFIDIYFEILILNLCIYMLIHNNTTYTHLFCLNNTRVSCFTASCFTT